jgi:hypothetical protein
MMMSRAVALWHRSLRRTLVLNISTEALLSKEREPEVSDTTGAEKVSMSANKLWRKN